MEEVTKLDPRKKEDLFCAFENADYIVRKRFRPDIDKYSVCDIPGWMSKSIQSVFDSTGTCKLGDNIQLVKIEKLIYDEKENLSDKLTTVYHTMSSFENTSVIMLALSDGNSIDLYLGVAERGISADGQVDTNARGNKLAALKTSFEANFPGSFINEYEKETTKQKETVVENGISTEVEKEVENDVPIKKDAIIRKAFENAGAVSCVTGVASFRNKTSKANEEFVQGMEKLFDAMSGKKFSVVFIADCKGINEIENLCANYEDIYSKLSPFAQSQQTVGKTDGVSNTESFIKGVTDTTNNSVSDTLSHSHSVGKSSSDSVGGSVTVGGKAGIPLVAEGHVDVSANYNHTWGRQENDTDTDAKTTTSGTAKSLTEQNSVAESISSSTNDGLQISIQNRAVKTLLDRIDEQIKHLRACEAFGVFDFGCYFIAQESAISKAAASVYDSLMRGEESGSEVSSVSTWIGDEASKVIKYLSRFYHPLIAVPNLSKKLDGNRIEENNNADAPKDQEENKRTENAMLYDILPVTPSTIVSGKEIALQMGLPKKSISGVPVSQSAEFGRNIISLDNSNPRGLLLGSIYHMQKPSPTPVELDINSLAMHTFITGSTGAGKSNTVFQILSELKEAGKTFLVVEPAKGEYKHIFGGKGVDVYGTNPNYTALLKINPFSFPEKIHILEHLDRLVEIFNVCWPMYAAMPAVLKEAIERAYISAGWDLQQSTNRYNTTLYPTFADVLENIQLVMDESAYSADNKGDYTGALSVRLKSLTNGINGMIFTANSLTDAELFDKNVIVDLSRVGSTETKALIMGLLVMKLQEYRMSQGDGTEKSLRHITVLEEAHNLLKKTSSDQSMDSTNLAGKSVEMLANAIAEMRAYGEGFIIADQAPGLLDKAVIRNTNTKIIMRLPDQEDRELVGRAAGLNDSQIVELSRLGKGVAAVYQNDWIAAVLCNVKYYDPSNDAFKNIPISKETNDDELKSTMLNAILRNELSGRFDKVDEGIIKSSLPTQFKCRLYDFLKSSDNDRLQSLGKLAYAFFNSSSIMAHVRTSSSVEDFKRIALEYIEPSLNDYSDKEKDLVLFMLIHEQSIRNPDFMPLYLRFSDFKNGGVK